MKQIRRSVLSLMFMAVLAVSSFASNPLTKAESDTRSEVIKEISQLIGEIDSETISDFDPKVRVKIYVNEKNEIVVLSTSSEASDGFLKSRLNYHKLETEVVTQRRIYELDVVFKR